MNKNSRYIIISTKENSIASKVSINVRIYERLSQEELGSIAKNIKSQFPNYRLTFILYYLPKMEPGAGAWATSHYDPTLSINILGPTQAEYDQLSKDYKTDKYSSLKKLLSEDYNSSLIGDDFEIISDDKNNPIIKIYPLSVLGEDNDVSEEIIRLDIVTISMFSFTYLNIKSISVIAIPNQLSVKEPGNLSTAKWTKLKSYETKVSINRNNAIAVIKKWKLGSGFHDLYDDSYGLIGMPTGKYNIVMGEKAFFDQLIN